MKKIMILPCFALAFSLLIACTSVTTFAATDTISSDDVIVEPYGLEENGYAMGSSFEKSYRLNNANGNVFNFYVRNDGKCDVRIRINNEEAKVIEPGSGTHVSVPLTWYSKNYQCTVYPVQDGADFDIFWAVAVRTVHAA